MVASQLMEPKIATIINHDFSCGYKGVLILIRVGNHWSNLLVRVKQMLPPIYAMIQMINK